MQLHINLDAPFSTSENFELQCRIHSAGSFKADLPTLIKAVRSGDKLAVKNVLIKQKQCFGLCVDTNEFALIAVDRVRGHPIFYSQLTGDWVISNNTSIWEKNPNLVHLDKETEHTFLRTGYTTGRLTLIKELFKLRPGEFALLNKKTKAISTERYYIFRPSFASTSCKKHRWGDKLDSVLNRVFERVIEQANGKTIWLPLSAGYDSRTVLAKLLELGYGNIRTFSYGTPGNMESVVAKEIADKAGVPWFFVSSRVDPKQKNQVNADLRDFFLSTGSCSATPPIAEYLAIKQLFESGQFHAGDLIVNGQTGDFLTGGASAKHRELQRFD